MLGVRSGSNCSLTNTGLFGQALCGVFSVQLYNLLKARRKMLCLCFLSMLSPKKFHFSSRERFWFLNAHPECLKHHFETASQRCRATNVWLWGVPPSLRARLSKKLKRGFGF